MMFKISCFFFLFSFLNSYTQQSELQLSGPPMGWNSWDSYGGFPNQEALLNNLRVMASRLKPYGYTYFVIDAGWHKRIHEIDQGQGVVDQYGFIGNYKAFPIGMAAFADSVHAYGLRFGLHIMRGISRNAWRTDFPIWGTSFTARDIVDTTSVCSWSKENYGIDMTKEGAQAYYDSFIGQLVAWGIDFIKVDDITEHPEEIQAVKNAVLKTGKNVVISLSPGEGNPLYMNAYNESNMVRVTSDVWDNQSCINQTFDAWKKWSAIEGIRFWVDMDMIPFGHLSLYNPNPNYLTEKYVGEGVEGGKERMCALSKDQQYTLITLRAMSASPLFMGGDLPTTDEFSFSLLTNKEILACNKNGIIGKLVSDSNGVEIWKSPLKTNPNEGWIGLFNRTNQEVKFSLTTKDLGIDQSASLYNIWQEIECKTYSHSDKLEVSIKPNGVAFYKYRISE